MEEPQPQSGPVTLVISEVVEPSKVDDYEAWTKGINRDARQFEGFLGVEIIRPRDHAHPEYVVIVKFESYDRLRRWLISPTYRAWMDQSYGLIAARSQQQLSSGLELWFTLPQARLGMTSPLPSPPYYKQVVLGVLAVYPLILLANRLLGPLLGRLPPLLGLFISVIFVSALLTYPVMPWLSKGLAFWLYPTGSKVKVRAKERR
ncbi:antibiotic biosynthesis monooxygenase [Phormidium tenue]|uniref:Antibiotic biosynthesis monooxygenase n=1 Tax=Phormidium tenue NIES-30 TaxID=549789 RepID=A0A1U7J9X7_9CYAN|nr:antibiotic biosynthesis monooxygenase [Phormidium tenue]MBD2230713.1 antibiotic biosynthesis monooxygenase [Phormidium tenue FACHB-1052]OKH50229.1 antibiotic biosynthesis monooxygenase [Phormidium tenue NIES-30]